MSNYIISGKNKIAFRNIKRKIMYSLYINYVIKKKDIKYKGSSCEEERPIY